ncbi:MAG: amidohydrolase family protein [Bacteroidales bacterium]|nr:amidohydrolase family protein [Bacteroidales bacterium]
MNIRICLPGIVSVALLAVLMSCNPAEKYYTVSDFQRTPKIDAHFHYLTRDAQYMHLASSLNFKLLNPNWDGPSSIDEQLAISVAVQNSFPHEFAFFGTFPVDSFGKPGFTSATIARVDDCIKAGASGIKIWKNIGMVLQDHDGRYVMINDTAFSALFEYLEKKKIPVMGHLGEPRDCWLPENEMIDPGAVTYFREHPQYYMYLHPEAPSYMAQINSRDSILHRYPALDFIGAHLASLEWSVDELAKTLDKYPNLKVDIAARMNPVQYQSAINRAKVRDFMIKYQDRIIYGTDFEVHDEPGLDIEKVKSNLQQGWLDQWIYMTTDSTLGVKGLKLPAAVIDKIYYKNAEKYFR